LNDTNFIYQHNGRGNMKAQGMPISVIIIAALGILVLIVIAAIFSGQIGKFGRVANECPNRCQGPMIKATELAVSTEAMSNVQCLPGESKLPGTFIQKGQTGVGAENLQYCSACCVQTG